MKIEANSPDEYIDKLPENRKEIITKLRKIIRENLPDGFEETMNYGMIGYVVPKSVYPPGYHVKPQLPLPFIYLASQKNHIALYHSGIYSDTKLFNWFRNEYAKLVKSKPDMGKGCIRFKNPSTIPFNLIGKLAQKISVQDWIKMYEKQLKSS